MQLKQSFAIKTDKQNKDKDLGEAMGVIMEENEHQSEIVEEIEYGHYKQVNN